MRIQKSESLQRLRADHRKGARPVLAAKMDGLMEILIIIYGKLCFIAIVVRLLC
jgi:hypothetical protein